MHYLRAESERDEVSCGLEGEYRGRGHSALQPGGREPVRFRPDHAQVYTSRENGEWNWVGGGGGLRGNRYCYPCWVSGDSG
jgi:hypothetical protein